jgi:hypothetical protein
MNTSVNRLAYGSMTWGVLLLGGKTRGAHQQ